MSEEIDVVISDSTDIGVKVGEAISAMTEFDNGDFIPPVRLKGTLEEVEE